MVPEPLTVGHCGFDSLEHQLTGREIGVEIDRVPPGLLRAPIQLLQATPDQFDKPVQRFSGRTQPQR